MKNLQKIRSVFCEALEKETQEQREAYLSQACRNDSALRAEVEALLRAQSKADDFFKNPLVGPETAQDTISEGLGTVIGRYKLLEKIGEGGMAVVYMAEQAEPIRRKVALKIIKLGMDTRQVIARFEAERQALALMDHPSIAKVLDAGATETGRPYFVMELVAGVSITEYCDKNNLSTKDRLALFLQVCTAVQHAHQKGIIHRDIKPTNVMVTHHDGKPVPKVIDFGIAKATNQRLTEKTLFTRYAHIIGTPAYMSPEQAELSDLDVDTRSDIYSLGVLLYELLTGTTPFSEEELRKAGYIEMQRIIREQEPLKPSTRIRTAHVAQSRGEGILPAIRGRDALDTPVAQPPLAGVTPEGGGATGVHRTPYQQVRGDLDWIVMKSLEKDRARRYETTSALASDILRHLEHEPVLARGPGTMYRLQKFLRRHRVQALAALVMVVVAGVVVVILSMWNRDRLQLVEAEGFKHRAILSQAREQYAKADRTAAIETIKPILRSRHVGPEAQLLYAGILVDNRRSDEAVNILTSLLDDRPEIAGAAHSLLARILWESESPNAEKLKEIEEHRQKAEALLPETAEAYFLRAMTAVTVKEQVASLDRALQLDPGHYESRRLRAFTYYASRKCDRLRDDALVMTILRPRDPLGYSLRAIAWRELGRYRDATADYDIALALTPKGSPAYTDLSVQRSETLLRMGDYGRVLAEAPIVETQDLTGVAGILPAIRGRDALDTQGSASLQYHVFCALTALGEYDKATALFRRIINPGHEARSQFQDWCMKYVFDALEAGRSWYLPGPEPAGVAFLPMVEADEIWHQLSTKAERVITDGFTGNSSPDGKKLAFSLGVHGYSGVAVFEPATQETELLIVPGKDPIWSPDGQYIAFVRDREVLRLEELATAERENQDRPLTDEEVWIIKADGTEPRRLARGGWPFWSQDSTHVYYHSRVDKMLCSISIVIPDAKPERIIACSNNFPSISPDGRRVAYLQGTSLIVKDLGSEVLIAQWPVPVTTWGGAAWSPAGTELSMGTGTAESKMGLWIYPLDRSEPVKTLAGPIAVSSWSPDGQKLIFSLGPPYFEIWSADLDPHVPTIEALAPARTLQEHYEEMLRSYSRRIEADPTDAYPYYERARYYDSLHDRANANADMRRWSVVMGGGMPSGVGSTAPRDFRRVIHLPFDCQIVFSAERPVNGIPLFNVAFGQKGRCQMKLFEIPMVVVSLLGLGVLSGLDASPAYADFTLGKPTNLGPVINSPMHDVAGGISADGLSVGFTRSSGSICQAWVAHRTTTSDPWEDAELIGSCVDDISAVASIKITLEAMGGGFPGVITADGLEVYFNDMSCSDLWMIRRETVDADWGPPQNLGPIVNSPSGEMAARISPDGLTLYFSSYQRPGGYGGWDLWVTKRATRSDPWGVSTNLGPAVNSPSGDYNQSVSADGLVLFFVSPRPGGLGPDDMYMARRASVSEPWGQAVNLGPAVNSSADDYAPWVSGDGSVLCFASTRPGGYGSADLWQAPIIPIVDFNGDGQVDGKEVLAMAEHWGQSERLYDIGLGPMGDGTIDVNDLTVLAGYVGRDVNDPTLVAHWTLDQTEGMLAEDSAGDNNAMVLGGATWEPAGQIGGALAFDGKDDFARSGKFVLDPAAGPFSVITWVKGGAAGRVIVSQASGADWLYLNQYGMLTTDVKSAGREGKSLTSDAFMIDDQWHRVALVWDGTNRALHMDGVEVARDTQPSLAASSGSLHIGGGKNVTSATFWSGLIDDVRIYNRVVQP